ncbi:MAG: hypothetical protein H7Y00_09820 [Fimbriimonadaceae bacterium]|nr:hypothetical protein [Chitinophagales bacterium]
MKLNSLKNIFICSLLTANVTFYFVSCKNEKTETVAEKQDTVKKQMPVFSGIVVYEATAVSDVKNDVDLFYSFAPNKVEIYFAENKFRMIEYGGLSGGNIFIDLNEQKAWHLDTIKKIAHMGEYSDFDNASDIIKEQMPDHFSPTLEATTETENILGYDCRKYKVLRSGFVRPESETFIWATDAFQFPHARYDVQTDINKVTAPTPLILGYRDGAVLKMTINDDGLLVTYTITKLDTNQNNSAIFGIPKTYTIQ